MSLAMRVFIVAMFAAVAAVLGSAPSAWGSVAVSLTAPANGATPTAPVTVSATASAGQGYTVSKVEFFDGSTLIGTDTTSPYGISWNNAPAGSHTLTAKATAVKDGNTQTATSSPVNITVNVAPSVTLTSPAPGAIFAQPAHITASATASDSDGTIASVRIGYMDFYWCDGGEITVTAPPFNYAFTPDTSQCGADGPNGEHTYTIYAQATDNRGATAWSELMVTVTEANSAPNAKLYFIHPDHLNTPRLITNDQQQVVWRWDQQEPFGVNVPNENPSGLGAFEFPVRFPGQYFDKETNQNYNYFRDCYDPATGRYCQSDPIGLKGGLNTYAYVSGQPLTRIDPFGLLDICPPGPKMKKCLEEIFGEKIDDVQVIIDPPMVYRHHGEDAQGNPKLGATTRVNKIYINMTCDQFWGGPPKFILHEYFHVLRQWAKGMTWYSYGLTAPWKESEAEEFGIQNAQRLRECLKCGGSK
jgi:RHS repeat-associated protein